MKNILFIVFFLLFLANSCQMLELESEVKTWKYSLIKNHANKYDSLGELYNQGLDYVINNLENIDPKDSAQIKKKIIDLSLEFIAQTPDYKEDSNLNSLTNAIENPKTTKYDQLSIDGQNLFKDLETQMSEFNPEMDINAFQNNIINIENKYLQANISSLDAEKLLKSGAIARYASVYWFDQFQKIAISKNLEASVWQKTIKLLYPKNKIGLDFYNVTQQSILGNNLAESICFSALRKN